MRYYTTEELNKRQENLFKEYGNVNAEESLEIEQDTYKDFSELNDYMYKSVTGDDIFNAYRAKYEQLLSDYRGYF